jgi:hypothetical protein
MLHLVIVNRREALQYQVHIAHILHIQQVDHVPRTLVNWVRFWGQGRCLQNQIFIKLRCEADVRDPGGLLDADIWEILDLTTVELAKQSTLN